MELYNVYEEILSENRFLELSNDLMKSKNWEFSNNSGSVPFVREDGFHFWYNELIDNSVYTQEVLNIINKRTSENFIIDRVYANGQTHGQPGHMHIDADDANTWTCLLYMNPFWNIEWGGETVISPTPHEVVHILPKPNSAVLFKSNILHFGSEPSRHFRGLRITVAFKLRREMQ